MSHPSWRDAVAALAVSPSSLSSPVTADEGGTVKRSADLVAQEKAPDRWAPFRAFLGRWEGTNQGSPGSGTVHREYRLVLGDPFIEVRNKSTYPPQEKNPNGEVHEDVGYVSFDRARKVFVLRQFHVEGFVNTYAAPAVSGSAAHIVFATESIKNIPPGWRAPETYRFEGPDEFVEVFELAEPGKEFTTYTDCETRLKRAR